MNYISWVSTFEEDCIEFVDEVSVVDESWLAWHFVSVDKFIDLWLLEIDVESSNRCSKL